MQWYRLQIVIWWSLDRLGYNLYNTKIDWDLRLTIGSLEIKRGHKLIFPIQLSQYNTIGLVQYPLILTEHNKVQ